jgi:hypothetical protein
MVHHIIRTFIASSILSVATLSASACWAQTDQAPVKMGLWHVTVTQTVTGMQLPPGAAEKLKEMGRPAPDAPRTSVYETCMTPEEWEKNMSQMQTVNKNCTRSNIVQNTHQMSFDMTCTSDREGEGATGHMQMIYDSPERTHGLMTMKIQQGAASATPMNVAVKMDTHFLNSNCGDLKPGENKPVVQK